MTKIRPWVEKFMQAPKGGYIGMKWFGYKPPAPKKLDSLQDFWRTVFFYLGYIMLIAVLVAGSFFVLSGELR